jgi:effector-binding domain-containing protein
MEAKVIKAQAMYEEKEKYRQLCGELYDNGIIKQDTDGSIIAVEDPVERESIRTKSKKKTQTQQEEESMSMSQQKEMNHPILDDDQDKNSEMT